jgi:hypothetical protein
MLGSVEFKDLALQGLVRLFVEPTRQEICKVSIATFVSLKVDKISDVMRSLIGKYIFTGWVIHQMGI